MMHEMKKVAMQLQLITADLYELQMCLQDVCEHTCSSYTFAA